MSTPLRERPDAPLGTLIFRAGLLPAEVIENALEEGVRTGRRLGEILVERGLIKEDDLTRLLAGQKGVPFVSLRERSIDPEAARLLDEDQAKLFCALPIAFEEGTLLVAVADPTNEVLTRNVSEAIGRPARFVVAARTEVLEAITRAYAPVAVAEPAFTAPAEPESAEAGPVEPGPEPAASPAPEPEQQANGHHPDVPLEAVPDPAPPPEAPAPVAPAPAPAPTVPEVPAAPVASPPPAAYVPEPAVPPAPRPPALRVPAPEPAEEAAGTSPATARVTIRLTTGERVPVADFPTVDSAKEHARSLIRDLGESGDEWPLVNGRFLRPETIVSVDVESL